MPIPEYNGQPEEQWISECMGEIGSEYDQEQALAICYKQMEMKEVEMEHEEEPILNELPDVSANETEDRYLQRCIPVLYPEKFDQQQAASYCADHYQNKVTVTDMKKQNSFDRVALKLKGIKIA